MSNVINAAFHTIRAAQGMKPSSSLKFKEDGVDVTVTKIPCLVPGWPSFWKEPRRHLRMKRAAKRHNRLMKRPFGKRLAELEAEAFIRGTGEL